MKRSLFFSCLFVVAFAVGAALAQEPPLPSQPESPPPRPQLEIPAISSSVPPPPLMPSVPPTASVTPAPHAIDLSQLDAVFKQSPLGQVAEEYRLRVETRQLQNKTVNDPQVVAAKIAVKGERTDLGKRKRLETYYNVYYARMRELAGTPEMKTRVDQLKASHLAALAQPRVRPVIAPAASPAKVRGH